MFFVLTRANLVEQQITDGEGKHDPGVQEEQEVQLSERVRMQFEEHYEKLCQTILHITQQVIQERNPKLANAAAIVSDIPVVAAGFRKPAIPGCDDWLSHLWRVAYSRVGAAAAPAFVEATAFHRLQPEGAGPDRSMELPSQRNIMDAAHLTEGKCNSTPRRAITHCVSTAQLSEFHRAISGQSTNTTKVLPLDNIPLHCSQAVAVYVLPLPRLHPQSEKLVALLTSL